ncbi:hypothetical protein SAMN02745166_05092 [Prosthecobacter debontii]|uniref:Lipoprotein n=1 Tax=Prosthecobacter debontii TaxID=48467 RepID=A0A1T4Z678_9BACT|nr:hypothetical protein [Prosthecobacter debontii]SKB09081.1 hypothetical protein SAMN02745166_05092 [Prosthecobacter debontii]
MKPSSILVLLTLTASIVLTGCGTSESPAPATSTGTSATASAPASATNADGDITDPNQVNNRTHLSKAAAQIQDGVTTKKDVVRKLGLFYKKGTDAAGRATATWTFNQSKGTAKSYIPGAAFIPGAMITYYQTVTISLDANETVVSHSFVESTKEKTGMGFSYGS